MTDRPGPDDPPDDESTNHDRPGPAPDSPGDDRSPGPREDSYVGDRRDDPLRTTLSDRDLQGIATWEPRSVLDRLAVLLYAAFDRYRRAVVAAFVVAVLALQIAWVVLATFSQVELLLSTVASLVPAAAVVGYVWRHNGTPPRPLAPMAVAFVVGGVSAGYALIVNEGVYYLVGRTFVVVSAPWVEEIGKLAGVWAVAYLYGNRKFERVVDGAAYGAAAGLGFAMVENPFFIIQRARFVGLDEIVWRRATVAPGHVVWSGIAGYYLGLATFNREHWGPIVVKGLCIATVFHFLNNAAVVALGGEVELAVRVVALGVAGYVLYSLVDRYREAHRAALAEPGAPGDWDRPPRDP